MVQFQLAGGRYRSHHHAFAIFGQIEKPLLRVLRALTSCNFTRFLLTHCLLLLKVYIWKWVLSPFNVSLENQLDLERNLEKGEFLRLPGTDPQLIATFCLMLWTWTRFNLIVHRDALNLWAFALYTDVSNLYLIAMISDALSLSFSVVKLPTCLDKHRWQGKVSIPGNLLRLWMFDFCLRKRTKSFQY